MIKQGDKVKVRLNTGAVVVAVYGYPMVSDYCERHHHVIVNGRSKISGRYGNCRFIGPACGLAPL